jgi:hypothetical protein
VSYYRPTTGLGAVPRIILPAQRVTLETVRPEDGLQTPVTDAVAPPSGGATPSASIAGGGFPWIIPAVGVLAIGGFVLWRRHQKKKGATP